MSRATKPQPKDTNMNDANITTKNELAELHRVQKRLPIGCRVLLTPAARLQHTTEAAARRRAGGTVQAVKLSKYSTYVQVRVKWDELATPDVYAAECIRRRPQQRAQA